SPLNARFRGSVSYDSQTDRDGRSVFGRVAPGRLTVYRPVRQGEGQTLSNLTHIDVAPGQTVRLQLGGTGRPVVGRLALPAGAATQHPPPGLPRLPSQPPASPPPGGSGPPSREALSAPW